MELNGAVSAGLATPPASATQVARFDDSIRFGKPVEFPTGQTESE